MQAKTTEIGTLKNGARQHEHNRVICQFAQIDANGVITLNALFYDSFNNNYFNVSKPLPFSNFYVDKNYFDIIIADPILKAHYYLYNIYYIEDGKIYVAGITARCGYENKEPLAPKNHMTTFLNFDWSYDREMSDFKYEMNGVYSVRFNPNYFSQVRSFENHEKISPMFSLYNEIINLTVPYDRPSHYIQKAFYMAGAASVKKYGIDYDTYRKIISYVNSRSSRSFSSCYFSFEQFYLSGVCAAINFYKN